MTINRRNFLKATGMSLGGLFLLKLDVKQSSDPNIAVGMLYDATICVGCRACQTACKKVHNLPPELDTSGLHEAPRDLSGKTWTLIELYKSTETGGQSSFVKKQCMHCFDPACVSVCPVGALQKLDSGPVIYDDKKCIGCRYCMAACPYNIPKYQWEKALPLIQKCNFCADRLEQGLKPACAEACPTGSLIFGKRSDLIAEAEQRIQKEPDRYVNHVYGKDEVGGASMLYLAAVPFEKLGFPTLDGNSLPEITKPYLESVPWQIGLVGSLMVGTYLWTHRKG